jgi:hypothetical protein
MAESGTYDEATLARQKVAAALSSGYLKPEENIKSWTQGLANLAKAGIGGYMGYQADQTGREEKAKERADLYSALGLPAPATATPEESPSVFSKIASLFSGGGTGAPASPVAAPAGPVVAPPPPVIPSPAPGPTPAVPVGAPMPLAPTAIPAPAPTPRVPVEPMGDVVRTNPDGSIAGNITAPTIPATTKVAQVLGGAPAGAPSGLLAGVPAEKRVQIATMLSSNNPTVKALGQAEMAKVVDPKTVQSLGEGYIWKNGKVERAYTPEDKTPTSVLEHKFYVENFKPTKDNPTPMSYEAFTDKKARAAATNVSVNGNEPAVDKAIGEAKGKVVAAAIENGDAASTRLRTLGTLAEANRSGGDDISSGPLGKAFLTGKQGLSELTGIDYKGLPESEVTQKVGFDLATKMVKAISSRPTQMEFGKALENVPGIYMSKPGREAMLSILSQDAQADRELGRLANKFNTKTDGSWQDVKDQYYETHPLISPFTGKPFGEADIKMLATQPGAGATPATPSGPDPAAIAEAKKRGLLK